MCEHLVEFWDWIFPARRQYSRIVRIASFSRQQKLFGMLYQYALVEVRSHHTCLHTHKPYITGFRKVFRKVFRKMYRANKHKLTWFAKVRRGETLFRQLPTATTRTQATKSFSTVSAIPFYGLPRPTNAEKACRVSLFTQNAAIALLDPTRADAVAAVGELTGKLALERLHQVLKEHVDGQIILKERPIVSKDTIPFDDLIASARTINDTPTDQITFGQAYGAYLAAHNFDPDERDSVKYLTDPDLSYVMLRYRQCHDFWHAITDLPPTVLGELGLKWLELFQTGMPLAALSSTVGSVRLSARDQRILWQVYLPWAKRVGHGMPFGTLMTVYYEKEFDTPLEQLRARLWVEPAPQIERAAF
jgi:ubiquinone biosynthesis protein COQ4